MRSKRRSVRPGSRARRRGFTLIEMLVTIVLITVGIVGVFGAIRAMAAADSKARTVDLLQSLAEFEMNQVGPVTDPTQIATSGDFTQQGYPLVTYTVTVETEDATNLDKITVTTSEGKEQATLVSLLYVPPTTAGTTNTPGGATP
jgi:prepilin-type N-terminal cleavage/methylation domain-containing protein